MDNTNELMKDRNEEVDLIKESGGEPLVFISYAHDDQKHKDWVLELSTRLRSNGVNVILDRWNLRLGSDLALFMEKGLSKSMRVICICSKGYVEKANTLKGGTGYEKKIMTAKLIKDQDTDMVIPLIRNNSSEDKTPAFLNGLMYIDFEDDKLYEFNYETLLRDVLDEPVLPIPPIGKNPFSTIREFEKQTFIPSSEKYCSPSSKGKVSFDYSNNNGRYSIGAGTLLFEIAFSKASDKSIHIYNDPSSIRTVAIGKGLTEIDQVDDARVYDASSRARNAKLNEIAVLQNANGFYAAIKITGIKDDSRMDNVDEVTFEYRIQTNGSPRFS